jgi:hypothetical protein
LRVQRSIYLLAIALFAGPLTGFCSGVVANEQNHQEIILDAVCTMPEARNPKLQPGNPAPSTRRMAELLSDINRKLPTPGYMSDRMVTAIQNELAATTNLGQRMKLQFQLGIEQTQAGRPDQAINTFAALERNMAPHEGQFDERSRVELRLRKAIAFLRLGEQENCLATHNPEACILPLQPPAYHLLPRGSRGAIILLNEQLAEFPNDLSARWLLNIAHMTLGEYPDKVPPQFVIPPKVFESEYPMPRFANVAGGLGLDLDDLAGGVIVDDFDNDGLYDIVTSAWDFDGQLRYFHNNGNGTFTERTSEAGLVGETGGLNIQQTDYNNDGLLDIWLMRGAWLGKRGRIPGSLLRNNGDGTFTDVTEQAGLMSFHPSQAARWFDYDGDGWLDLFIGNESVDPDDPDYCELYHNNHDGTFTECARACGINIAAFVKAVACADYDNDGRPDLYLSIRGGRCILLHNDGPDANGHWRFSNVTSQTGGVGQARDTFGTFFFDYDNDGWQDLLVFGYSLPDGVGDIAADYLGLPNQGNKTKLFHNNHDGTFSEVTREAHLNRICLTMGNNYGDLDNDGWLDFYCGTGDPDFRTLIPKRMFRNAEGRFFQDVSTATGTAHLQKGHGIAFADLNDDGAQDIYISLGGAYTGDGARNALFLNPGSTNHWVKLKLVGTRANRAAIGACIKVTIQTPKGSRDLYRVVSSGGSFGANPLRQEIGLADATEITAVDIRWPGSDTRQTVTGLGLNHSYQITEGQATPLELKLHPVQLNHNTVAKATNP